MTSWRCGRVQKDRKVLTTRLRWNLALHFRGNRMRREFLQSDRAHLQAAGDIGSQRPTRADRGLKGRVSRYAAMPHSAPAVRCLWKVAWPLQCCVLQPLAAVGLWVRLTTQSDARFGPEGGGRGESTGDRMERRSEDAARGKRKRVGSEASPWFSTRYEIARAACGVSMAAWTELSQLPAACRVLLLH